jgi:uncharacterized DUF497 family protein
MGPSPKHVHSHGDPSLFILGRQVTDRQRRIILQRGHRVSEPDAVLREVGPSLRRVLVVIYTWRGERVRLISARQATPDERRQYEEST